MIIFSIDTMPLSNNILASNDYSSKIIYSAICDTLFKYDLEKKIIIKNACSNYEYSKNKKILTIKIRDDLYFNNGAQITANDYYITFKKILNSKTHIGIIFSHFFTDVKVIDNYTLQLFNKIKNDKSYEILSIYSTGYLDNEYMCGPYYIEKKENDYIILKRNKFYRKKMKNKESESIKFILTDGLDDYKLFYDNKVQITNNTIADIYKVNEYNYVKEENYIYLNIIFSNKFMNKKYNSFRKKISNSIDSKKISATLNSNYDEYNSFIIDDINIKKHNLNNKYIKTKNEILSIGYNNFYPNKIIAEEIKKQLENNGFKIKLVENKFNLKNDYDLNITLNHLEYISESALINGSFLHIILEKSLINKFLLKKYNITHKKFWLNIINTQLLKTNYKIPILQMKGYYLKKDKYSNFNYIELNYDEL